MPEHIRKRVPAELSYQATEVRHTGRAKIKLFAIVMTGIGHCGRQMGKLRLSVSQKFSADELKSNGCTFFVFGSRYIKADTIRICIQD